MTAPIGPADEFLALVRQVAAEYYHVFGELGREGDEDIWYLARAHGSPSLVALKLHRGDPGADGKPAYDLEVAEELDGQVSVGSEACPGCGTALRRWARFCTHCGVDLTEAAGGDGAASTPARQALLEQVRRAGAGVYEVIGEMAWAGGAGHVYFALEKATERLVRLRLRTEDGGGGELVETGRVLPGAGRVAATYVTSIFESPLAPANPVPLTEATSSPPMVAGIEPGPASGPVTVVIFGRVVDAMRAIKALAAAVVALVVLQLLQWIF